MNQGSVMVGDLRHMPDLFRNQTLGDPDSVDVLSAALVT